MKNEKLSGKTPIVDRPVKDLTITELRDATKAIAVDLAPEIERANNTWLQLDKIEREAADIENQVKIVRRRYDAALDDGNRNAADKALDDLGELKKVIGVKQAGRHGFAENLSGAEKVLGRARKRVDSLVNGLLKEFYRAVEDLRVFANSQATQKLGTLDHQARELRARLIKLGVIKDTPPRRRRK